MKWLVLMGLVGCYSPTVHPGAPCGPGGACPTNLTCSAQNTCEVAGGVGADAANDSPMSSDAPATDAVSVAAPPNDLPGGAIDVSAGGDFTADLTGAHDDASAPSAGGNACGGDGGLDVFYKLHLAADETIYLDTFNSDFDTVIRVFHGSCSGGAAPLGTICHDNAPACSSMQTVWLGTMRAGDNCIVVDGADGTQTGYASSLRVERGGRTGQNVTPPGIPNAQTYTFSNDTTNASSVEDGSCAMHGDHDQGYAFSLCPGQTRTVGATTCNSATGSTSWDTAVWARGPGGELACKDDDGAGGCQFGGGLSTISFPATGNHLFWVIVDGGGDQSVGAYELDLNFQ